MVGGARGLLPCYEYDFLMLYYRRYVLGGRGRDLQIGAAFSINLRGIDAYFAIEDKSYITLQALHDY